MEQARTDTVVHYNACPLCGGSVLEIAYPSCASLVSEETFTIVRCTTCQFLFTQDVPLEADIQQYYKYERYIPHNTTHTTFFTRCLNRGRQWLRLPGKRRIVEKNTGKKTGTLLDIGCGTGEFPLFMQQSGWTVTAIEPNADARNHSREKGIDCKDVDSLASFKDRSFDSITLWHVLEHVHNLQGTMDTITRLLSENGCAVIAVPNILNPLPHIYKSHDVPRHLWHFTPDTMAALAAKHGFQIRSIKVLHLDPLYMGIYYEHMTQGFAVRGVMLGILSFLYGLILPKRAASLVYIMKRI